MIVLSIFELANVIPLVQYKCKINLFRNFVDKLDGKCLIRNLTTQSPPSTYGKIRATFHQDPRCSRDDKNIVHRLLS